MFENLMSWIMFVNSMGLDLMNREDPFKSYTPERIYGKWNWQKKRFNSATITPMLLPTDSDSEAPIWAEVT